MTALVPAGITGRVVWLGRVASRDAGLASLPCDGLKLDFAGPEGEDHGGLTRPSCSRVTALYPRGTEIRNTRQISILAAEDLESIAETLGIAKMDPSWLGATMVIRGIPDFSYLPPSARLQFADGSTLTVDMQNEPCNLPAKVIEQAAPGFGRGFKNAASGRRGVTAWVER